MMPAKAKKTLIAAIQNQDYVRAVSQVDLLGNPTEMFLIRAALVTADGSNVRLLLEAYLMEQFNLALQSIEGPTNRASEDSLISHIGEVIIYCNVFLDTDITCERLLQKLITTFDYSASTPSLLPRRQISVKFASGVTGGSSSASSIEVTRNGGPCRPEAIWNVFCSVLNIYEYARPLLQKLIEHMLVNSRGYVQDFSEYQAFADQLSSILRALRFPPDQMNDQCDCAKSAIPIFLTHCVSEIKNRTVHQIESSSFSSDSFASDISRLSDIYNGEQVQEFWSAFKNDPIGLYSVFIDRLRFIAESLSTDSQSKSRDQLPCFCPCHLEQWKDHLISRLTVLGVEQRGTDVDLGRLLKFLVSKMCKFIPEQSGNTKRGLGLFIEDILDSMSVRSDGRVLQLPVAMNVPSKENDCVGPGREADVEGLGRLGVDGVELTRTDTWTTNQNQPAFDPLESTDQSTSLWSGGTVRLPLQPDTNELLETVRRQFHFHNDESSSSEMEVIQKEEIEKRKQRFNEEVLAFQRRFRRSSSPSSNYASQGTDSEIESLPFEAPDNPATGRHQDTQALTPQQALIGRSKFVQTNDRATSPHSRDTFPKDVSGVEQASQTSLQFGHTGMQTDGASVKDAAAVAETSVAQAEVQTDTGTPQSSGSLISRKEEKFLHVQEMTKRDVQRIFRSAQAFANIC